MILNFLIITSTILTVLNCSVALFNSSVEFAICSRIPSSVESYHTETSILICIMNLLTGICMVEDFSRGYSQTDSNFNFDINFNVTVDSYMNGSFHFSFSKILNGIKKVLKDLRVFTIMKLESTSKIRTQFETIPQCLLFFLLFFYIILRNKQDIRLTHFLIAFVCLYSAHWFIFP